MTGDRPRKDDAMSEPDDKVEKRTFRDPKMIGAGLAIGVGVGVALNNLAIGVGVGLALGLALAHKKPSARK